MPVLAKFFRLSFSNSFNSAEIKIRIKVERSSTDLDSEALSCGLGFLAEVQGVGVLPQEKWDFFEIFVNF